MTWFRFFMGNNRKETRQVVSAVTPSVIQQAFHRRAKEIESLRQYDRGEKHIDAPDIRTLVQGVR